ncbi:MAG: NUDIX hydrolase, partial [Mycobacterium sp.]
MSDGDKSQPRRRRGRRRGRRSAGSGEAQSGNEAVAGGTPAGPAKPGQRRSARRVPERLRTVHETSAGGLVIDNI